MWAGCMKITRISRTVSARLPLHFLVLKGSQNPEREKTGKEGHLSRAKAFGGEQSVAGCKGINISTFPSPNPSSELLGLAFD